jgi:hypothetical protein
MKKLTVRVEATLMTDDGEMNLRAGVDQYGCVKAEMTVKEMTWPELFSDMEEFKEFVNSLPIIEGIELKEYMLEVA